MEKICSNFNFFELEEFWLWLVKGYSRGWFVEIRLMSIKDDRLYSVVEEFRRKNVDVVVRKSSQFFINKFEDLVKILKYRDGIFIKYSKVCYSLNPRYFINGDISGGYDNLRFADKIYFDVEKTNHEPLSDSERGGINRFVETIIIYMKRYNLGIPVIIKSGNGIHIIYKIRLMKIDMARREGYKKFINDCKDKLDNAIFHIDGVVDFTRTTALPETVNPKNGFKVFIDEGSKFLINDYYIKKLIVRKRKKPITQDVSFKGDVKKSLAWRILTDGGAPEGSLNNIILFYLKMLIRDFGEDFREYERIINAGHSSKWKLDINAGIKGKTRNFGVLINWCKENKEWCEKNGVNYGDYSY